MKFVSIPQHIEAVQFFVKDQNVMPAYVKIKTEFEISKVHNSLHDSWINIDEGDWIRVDTPNDVYPIKDSYMKTKYRAVE